MTVSENVSTRRFEWPADYYSGPVRAPILPKWAPFGCGGLAVVVLIIVFAGGAFLSSGGFVDLMDFVIGMTASEMKGQYAADVPAAQRKALRRRSRAPAQEPPRREGVGVHLQPFLERQPIQLGPEDHGAGSGVASGHCPDDQREGQE